MPAGLQDVISSFVWYTVTGSLCISLLHPRPHFYSHSLQVITFLIPRSFPREPNFYISAEPSTLDYWCIRRHINHASSPWRIYPSSLAMSMTHLWQVLRHSVVIFCRFDEVVWHWQSCFFMSSGLEVTPISLVFTFAKFLCSFSAICLTMDIWFWCQKFMVWVSKWLGTDSIAHQTKAEKSEYFFIRL